MAGSRIFGLIVLLATITVIFMGFMTEQLSLTEWLFAVLMIG